MSKDKVTHAVKWLTELARRDPDTKAAIKKICERMGYPSFAELAQAQPDMVVTLYEEFSEMVADMEAMERADAKERAMRARQREQRRARG